jgi:hypothetical protein
MLDDTHIVRLKVFLSNQARAGTVRDRPEREIVSLQTLSLAPPTRTLLERDRRIGQVA